MNLAPQRDTIFLCGPVHRAMQPEVTLSLFDLTEFLRSEGYRVLRPNLLQGCSLVHVARNELVAQFINSRADVMVTCDDDTAFDASSVTTSVKAVLSKKADVIGCAYVRNTGDRFAVEYWPTSVIDRQFKGFELEGHRFIEVMATGTGVLIVGKRAIAEMVQAHPKLLRGTEEDPRFSLFEFKEDRGEDFVFCDRARAAHLKIHCCTTARTTHYVRFGYTGDMQRQLEEGGATFDWGP